MPQMRNDGGGWGVDAPHPVLHVKYRLEELFFGGVVPGGFNVTIHGLTSVLSYMSRFSPDIGWNCRGETTNGAGGTVARISLQSPTSGIEFIWVFWCPNSASALLGGIELDMSSVPHKFPSESARSQYLEDYKRCVGELLIPAMKKAGWPENGISTLTNRLLGVPLERSRATHAISLRKSIEESMKASLAPFVGQSFSTEKEETTMAMTTAGDKAGTLTQVKSDVSAAAKRVAVMKVIRMVREPLVAFLAVRIADSGEERPEEEIEKETESLRLRISAFLKSDEGEAVVKYLIAKAWELVRTWVPEDLHWVGDVVAEELRIQAWAVGIDRVSDMVLEHVVPTLTTLGATLGQSAFGKAAPPAGGAKSSLAEKIEKVRLAGQEPVVTSQRPSLDEELDHARAQVMGIEVGNRRRAGG